MAWTIKDISVMAKSKDTMRGQLSSANIDTLISNISKLGASSVSIACPFDDSADYPNPKPTAGYLQTWVNTIRSYGLVVYWRNTWINFEGLYDAPKKTPTSNPAITLGTKANVLNGADTSSYLYKTYNFIKTNPSLFAGGDIWAPCPEPENQGIGAETTDMFTDYAVLGQWLVDLKEVSDSAFTDIGVSGVITGMTSVNGGTVQNNQVTSDYWLQIGRCCIDHYVAQGLYSAQLDTIHTNAGEDVYIGEWGPTAGSGGFLNDGLKADMISEVYRVFNSKNYIKGVSYWQSTDGAADTENILDPTTFAIAQSGRVVQKYFQGTSRVALN